jgi:hypothetical protein
MKRPYRVYIRERCRHFATLEEATAFCSLVFKRTGIVLGITDYRILQAHRPAAPFHN